MESGLGSIIKCLDREWPGMNSKIFNYKLSWLIGKMCLCGQVDKRVDNRCRGRSSSVL